jgi:hypothetical protein
VLEALSQSFREGLPMKLLYADELILMAETEEQLVEKINNWKAEEDKGVRDRDEQVELSGKFLCGVCKKGVGLNLIRCIVYMQGVDS